MRRSFSLSWFLQSPAQPLLKLSQARTSTPRSPRSDQSAISIAPVSEAGTMPSTYLDGIPSTFLLRSMTSASLLLPILARCDRPRAASLSTSRVQPGRLAQGPEEKQGLLGVWEGFINKRWGGRYGLLGPSYRNLHPDDGSNPV